MSMSDRSFVDASPTMSTRPADGRRLNHDRRRTHLRQRMRLSQVRS